MSQVLVLIRKQPQYLLDWHAQGLGQQQNEKLQTGLTLVWVFARIYFLYVQDTVVLSFLLFALCSIFFTWIHRGLFGLLFLSHFLLEGDFFHLRKVFIIIFFKQLFDDLSDEGVFSVENELLNTVIKLHSEVIKGEPW